MTNSMNDRDRSEVPHDRHAVCESPAVRDAIAGLTGNLGVEACAWQTDGRQVDARHAMRDAELRAAAESRESALTLMAEQGEGRP